MGCFLGARSNLCSFSWRVDAHPLAKLGGPQAGVEPLKKAQVLPKHVSLKALVLLKAQVLLNFPSTSLSLFKSIFL